MWKETKSVWIWKETKSVQLAHKLYSWCSVCQHDSYWIGASRQSDWTRRRTRFDWCFDDKPILKTFISLALWSGGRSRVWKRRRLAGQPTQIRHSDHNTLALMRTLWWRRCDSSYSDTKAPTAQPFWISTRSTWARTKNLVCGFWIMKKIICSWIRNVFQRAMLNLKSGYVKIPERRLWGRFAKQFAFHPRHIQTDKSHTAWDHNLNKNENGNAPIIE